MTGGDLSVADVPGVEPTITVAIACYNQGQFLFDSVGSVLAQSRPPEAIIVVDDGSEDATADICRLFPSVCYHRQDNGGLSAARNTGLALAETSHILFLDADDLLMPTAVAQGLHRFAERPGIAFAYGGYRDVTAALDPIAEYRAVEHPDAFLALLHDNHIAMHGTVIYDVAKLRAIGGFDTALRSCEDYDVYLKLARAHPIAAYPGIAAAYRRHGAAMSGNAARMIQTAQAVLRRQIAAGLTPEQLRTARAGIAFTTRFYSLQLVAEFRRAVVAPFRILATGIRADPRFPLRLAGAMWRALVGRRR